MANGIIIIAKPADWTSMDVCHPRKTFLRGPLVFIELPRRK